MCSPQQQTTVQLENREGQARWHFSWPWAATGNGEKHLEASLGAFSNQTQLVVLFFHLRSLLAVKRDGQKETGEAKEYDGAWHSMHPC